MAETIEPGSTPEFHLKGILTWGELLDDNTRKYIRSRFHADVFDGYGAVEVAPLGGLAWECNHHGFHVNADCVILEFLKNDEPVSAGESGEVVATSLFRHAMPAIRYALQDFAVPTDELCTCGRGLPLLKALAGRKVDCLITGDGELVSPFRIIMALQEIERVGQYQIVQEDCEHLLVNLKTEQGTIGDQKVEEILSICKSLVGEKVLVTVQHVAAITKVPGKKFQPVISKVKR